MHEDLSSSFEEPATIETDASEDIFLEGYYRNLYEELYDEQPPHYHTIDWPILFWYLTIRSLRLKIRTGYDSYWSRLSSRSIIQDIIDLGPKSLSQKVKVVIDPLDRQFIAMTRELDKPFFRAPEKPDHWWYFREPLEDISEPSE